MTSLFTHRDKAGFSAESAFMFSKLKYKIGDRFSLSNLCALLCLLVPSVTSAHSSPALPLFPSKCLIIPFIFHDLPPSLSFSNLNFLLSSSVSLSLSDLLVSSSCDITGHCSPLGLDTWPRCQATAVKGLSVIVCLCVQPSSCTRVFMSVYSYVSERCVSDFPRFALYQCMKNDHNRSTSMLYLTSKHADGWAASALSSTTEEECALH